MGLHRIVLEQSSFGICKKVLQASKPWHPLLELPQNVSLWWSQGNTVVLRATKSLGWRRPQNLGLHLCPVASGSRGLRSIRHLCNEEMSLKTTLWHSTGLKIRCDEASHEEQSCS